MHIYYILFMLSEILNADVKFKMTKIFFSIKSIINIHNIFRSEFLKYKMQKLFAIVHYRSTIKLIYIYKDNNKINKEKQLK